MQKILTQFTDKAMILLSDCSEIADLYEAKNPKLQEYFKIWLKKCEQLLKDYNKAEQSKFASIRAEILAAESGVFKDSYNGKTQAKRKKSAALIALRLKEAGEYLYTAYNEENEKINNAKNIINQIVLVALQNNIIPSNLLTKSVNGEILQTIWKILSSNTELKKGMNQVLAIVSFADALRLTEEALSNIQQQ